MVKFIMDKIVKKKQHKGYDGSNERKYRENFPELLELHMSQGHTFGTFGVLAKVNRDTLNEWLKKYPAFKLAREVGELKSEKLFEKIAVGQASGKLPGGSSSTLKMVMTNRFNYTDKTEISADESAKALLAQAPLINVVFTSTKKDEEK
jgi:hypothetical protein